MNTNAAMERRLDPFAFPAETSLRFVLVVVAGLTITCRMNFLMLDVFARFGGAANPIESSLSEAERLLESDTSGVATEEYFGRELGNAVAVIAELLAGIALQVALVPAVFAVAIVVYRTHPARIRRRRHLETLNDDNDPAFHREVRWIIGVSNVLPPPDVEIGKDLRSQDAQAFGLPNRYVLRLGGGLRILLRKAPSSVRAIVLHELGHIANRDVERTYLAQALWTTVIVLVFGPAVIAIGALFFHDLILPAMVNGMVSGGWDAMVERRLPAVGMLIFQVGVVLVGMAAIRAGLLRAREVFADWRADMWGAGSGLSDILRRQIPKGRKAGLARLLWLHPAPKERLRALNDPKLLFRVTPDLPFVVGFLLGLVVGNMTTFVGTIGIAMGMVSMATGAALAGLGQAYSNIILIRLANLLFTLAPLLLVAFVSIPFLGLAYAVSQTLGLQVQREAVESIISKRQGIGEYLRLWVWAALMALGIETAILISPLSSFWPSDIRGAFLILGWIVVLAVSTWLSLAYVRYFGQHLLGSRVGKRAPKWPRRFLVVVFAGLLGAFYLPLTVGRVLFIPSNNPETQQATWLFATAGMIAALLLYVVVFAGSWLLVQLKRLAWPPRCPSCGKTSARGFAVNQKCENCNEDLAPWLFAMAHQGPYEGVARSASPSWMDAPPSSGA